MNRKDLPPLLCITILHILWFVAALTWQNYYNGDSYEYIYLAENIKNGFYYGGNPALPIEEFRLSLRTPVYALFILLSYSLFGYNTLMILIAQNIISVASCWIVYTVFQKINPGKKYGWIYWLFIVTYPAQFFYADMLAPDHLLQFFLVLYFRELLLSLLQKEPKRIAAMSCWLILATLTKPVVYPYLIIHLLFSLFIALKEKRMLLVAAGALPLMVMAGYGYWNQKRTGLFHISSIQSINLLNFNINIYLANKNGKQYADSFIHAEKEKINAIKGLKNQYEYASERARSIIKQDFTGYAFFHLRESLRFFIEPGKSELDLFTGYLGYDFKEKTNFYDSYHKEGWKGAWKYISQYPLLPILVLIVLFNLLRLLGWGLFLWNRKIPLIIRLATSIFIIYFAIITGPVAYTRYFLPVILILNGCSLIGYSNLFQQLKKEKH